MAQAQLSPSPRPSYSTQARAPTHPSSSSSAFMLRRLLESERNRNSSSGWMTRSERGFAAGETTKTRCRCFFGSETRALPLPESHDDEDAKAKFGSVRLLIGVLPPLMVHTRLRGCRHPIDPIVGKGGIHASAKRDERKSEEVKADGRNLISCCFLFEVIPFGMMMMVVMTMTMMMINDDDDDCFGMMVMMIRKMVRKGTRMRRSRLGGFVLNGNFGGCG